MADDIDTRSPNKSYSDTGTSHHRTVTEEEYRDDLPFDPESAGSDELFEALSEIGKYSTGCKDQIYELAYNHFTQGIDPSDLKIKNGVYLRQIIEYAKSSRPEWTDSLQKFESQFFEGIEDSNFTSGNTRSTIDDPISPNQAREYLEKRKRQFTSAAEAAFGSSNESTNKVLIRKAQKAYLWNIWWSIQNSEIEDQPKLVQKVVHTKQLSACQYCGREQGLIGKYDIWLCRQCFQSLASNMGFRKYS